MRGSPACCFCRNSASCCSSSSSRLCARLSRHFSWSIRSADPSQWVGLDNLLALFRSAPYWASVQATLVFTAAFAVVTLGVALLFAFAAHHVLRGQTAYKTLILVPYAIAPAIAGIMWGFLFNPNVGPDRLPDPRGGICLGPAPLRGPRHDAGRARQRLEAGVLLLSVPLRRTAGRPPIDSRSRCRRRCRACPPLRLSRRFRC